MPELETPAMGMPFQLAGALIEIYVFRAVVGGVPWYVAARGTAGGTFTLILQDNVPGVVVNAALQEANTTGLGEVTVCGATYPLEISVSFPADDLILSGMGRASFLDGDALATNAHGIVIEGRTNCIVRDLSVQTQDGGGKICHCIYITDSIVGGVSTPPDNFTIDTVFIRDSDDNGIHLYHEAGLDWLDGIIVNCRCENADGYAIYQWTGDWQTLQVRLIIVLNHLGGDTGAIWAKDLTHSIFADNHAYSDCYFLDPWNLTIMGNNIAMYPPFTITNGITLVGATDVMVEGNTIDYTTTNGILLNSHLEDSTLYATWYCVLVGNTCDLGGGDGIELTGTCWDCRVISNTLRQNTGWDINISAITVSRTEVFHNLMTGAGLGRLNDGGIDTKLPEITVYVSDPDGNIGTHPAIVLTDGVDVTARFEIKIPSDFTELVRARVILVAGGTGNIRTSVSTNWGKICITETYAQHTDSIAAGEVAIVVNRLACINIAAALTGLYVSDLVGLEFTRHGSHANDTVNANCYLLALNIQYV